MHFWILLEHDFNGSLDLRLILLIIFRFFFLFVCLFFLLVYMTTTTCSAQYCEALASLATANERKQSMLKIYLRIVCGYEALWAGLSCERNATTRNEKDTHGFPCMFLSVLEPPTVCRCAEVASLASSRMSWETWLPLNTVLMWVAERPAERRPIRRSDPSKLQSTNQMALGRK